MRELGDARKTVQRRAIDELVAIAGSGNPVVTEKLRGSIASADRRVRWAGAYALGQIGAGAFAMDCADALCEAMSDDDGDIRWAATDLMVRLGRENLPEISARLFKLAAGRQRSQRAQDGALLHPRPRFAAPNCSPSSSAPCTTRMFTCGWRRWRCCRGCAMRPKRRRESCSDASSPIRMRACAAPQPRARQHSKRHRRRDDRTHVRGGRPLRRVARASGARRAEPAGETVMAMKTNRAAANDPAPGLAIRACGSLSLARASPIWQPPTAPALAQRPALLLVRRRAHLLRDRRETQASNRFGAQADAQYRGKSARRYCDRSL